MKFNPEYIRRTSASMSAKAGKNMYGRREKDESRYI